MSKGYMLKGRIIEAYVGEYASGKTENAIARAIDLAEQGRKVTLVDLDLAEPCYTLRPLIRVLGEYGVDVLAWETGQLTGMGETGQVLLPAARWVLKREGDIIFDIGYGVHGMGLLNLIDGIDDFDIEVVLVANLSRPITDTKDKLLTYADTIGDVSALVANTHLDEETTPKLIAEAFLSTAEAAHSLDVLLVAVSVSEWFMDKYPNFQLENYLRNELNYNTEEIPPIPPMRIIKRFMPQSFW